MRKEVKGLWIDRFILLIDGLNATEKMFLAEIDNLGRVGGCYANNAHFSGFFNLSKNRCSEIINTLCDKGFVLKSYVTDTDDVERRVLRLSPIVEISTGQSKSRQGQSKSRQGQSKSRLLYKDEKTNEKTNESVTRAIDFLKDKNLSAWETFCMQYKYQIDDFVKFCADFNDVFDTERLDYTVKIINSRLSRFARNWVTLSRKQNKTISTGPQGPKLQRLN